MLPKTPTYFKFTYEKQIIRRKQIEFILYELKSLRFIYRYIYLL